MTKKMIALFLTFVGQFAFAEAPRTLTYGSYITTLKLAPYDMKPGYGEGCSSGRVEVPINATVTAVTYKWVNCDVPQWRVTLVDAYTGYPMQSRPTSPDRIEFCGDPSWSSYKCYGPESKTDANFVKSLSLLATFQSQTCPKNCSVEFYME
jgi:hypothetical protein